jgi:hypothetical protein
MESTLTKNAEIAEVWWADAHAGEGRWGDLEDSDSGEHIIQTCGYLIPEDQGGKKLHTTIAQSFTPDGFYDHVIYIPTGMVRQIVKQISEPEHRSTANATLQTQVT